VPELAAINRRALGKRRTLVTPEGVDLSLSLAEVGQRVGAFFLDMLIMLLALILLTIVAIILIGAFRGPTAQVAAIVWLLGFFLLRNFYFILMEMGPRAATFGKRAMGLRVVARNGERLTADRVIARNLMREIEVFLPLSILAARASADVADTLSTIFGLVWALLFSLFPLFNRDRLRIGDLLAGTWVVEAPKVALLEDLSRRKDPIAARFQFGPSQLDAYGIAELQKLEEVLRRDDYSALKAVAETIGRKIGARVEPIDSKAFLTPYYGELRAHLERKLLLGNRKADKYAR